MSLFHAVAFVDHHAAQVIQFSSERQEQRKIHEHRHLTRQNESHRRSEQEFFGALCDALEGTSEILMTGGHQALAAFLHYADRHRPQTAARITAYEVVDHPSEKTLVALARKHFAKYDAMAGISLPR